MESVLLDAGKTDPDPEHGHARTGLPGSIPIRLKFCKRCPGACCNGCACSNLGMFPTPAFTEACREPRGACRDLARMVQERETRVQYVHLELFIEAISHLRIEQKGPIFIWKTTCLLQFPYSTYTAGEETNRGPPDDTKLG